MRKQLTHTTVYRPNEKVQLTVKNKPTTDRDTGEMLYNAEVVIKVKDSLRQDELKFATVDDIADFMAQVDYDEPQQRLL